jgi:hypothetical protein
MENSRFDQRVVAFQRARLLNQFPNPFGIVENTADYSSSAGIWSPTQRILMDIRAALVFWEPSIPFCDSMRG